MKRPLRFLRLAFIGAIATSFIFAGCTSPNHRRTTGEYFDDQAVNARVKTALLQDDEVAGLDVSTTTYDGVVQLSGFVASAEQRMRAEEVTQEVPGVQEVVNNITINPRAPVYGSPGEVEEPAMEPAPESEAQPREAPSPRPRQD